MPSERSSRYATGDVIAAPSSSFDNHLHVRRARGRVSCARSKSERRGTNERPGGTYASPFMQSQGWPAPPGTALDYAAQRRPDSPLIHEMGKGRPTSPPAIHKFRWTDACLYEVEDLPIAGDDGLHAEL